jgi:hypothetical protein
MSIFGKVMAHRWARADGADRGDGVNEDVRVMLKNIME